MTEGLPKGWVKTTLGEITEPSRERALPSEFPDLPYVGLEHIESQTMKLLGSRYAREIRSSSVRFSQGDVLYGKMRPYLNKVWVAEFDGLCSAEFLVFPKSEALHNQFLAARLNAEDFVTFANGQVSGERPRVDFEKLSHFPILLPPITEQEKIATKLIAALSGVERAEMIAHQAQERIKRYRVAVLDAAVTGELTRDWREAQRKKKTTNTETGESLLRRILKARHDEWNGKGKYKEPALPVGNILPKPPEGWTTGSLEQLTSANRVICYGILMPKGHVFDGIPYVKVRDMKGDKIDVDSLSRTSPEIATKYSRASLKSGDILLAIRGTYGRVVEVPPELDGGNITQDTARLAFTRLVDRRYFASFLRSQYAQNYFNHVARGVAVKGVNIGDVRLCPILLPPLAEQTHIVEEVERRLSAADHLSAALEQQLASAHATRQSLLHDAFTGRLARQNQGDEPASLLLDRMRAKKAQTKAEHQQVPQVLRPSKKRTDSMQEQPLFPDSLSAAWERMGRKADARRLLNEAGFGSDQVVQFYEALRATPEVRAAFQAAAQNPRRAQKSAKPSEEKPGEMKARLRLVELWLEDFKNLKDYTVRFDSSHGLDVVLGWNGTGKSNLFEALVIVFRDLHEWREKNRWPDKPMNGYRLSYEIDEHLVEITWQPSLMKRPELRMGPITKTAKNEVSLEPIKRGQLPLPRFVFGYYSGPTNRLAEHFLPMKQSHYIRLRKAKADDAKTLEKLLEQRRFFCAENHHAKYVLLAFSYKEDPKISEFLESRLRIIGFESALFIIRKPRWARPGSKAEDFWGATGIMRRVMERLSRYAIAPMILEQTVSYGYRSTTEDHYYFFLPDLESLHSFAAEYQDARTFFLALESTDFSELIHDVKIQVRVKATNTEQVSITFHQLSEGEQQLLMVLGLMRFTKSHQSLVLLDEPDTHLNPHWSVDYLKDLARVMSDDASESLEQQTSQILVATHDPLVIASLVKEQIHLLKRDPQTGACKWTSASVNPRGLGFTGILTSEMFGFRSDLDPETLADLDNKVRLIAKEEKLTAAEKKELEKIEQRLTEAGFSKAFSDPYYAAFVRAWGRRHSELMAGKEFLTAEEQQEIDRIAREVLEEAVAEVEQEVAN